MDVKYDFSEMTFSYELKHKAIQRKTNRFGYTMPMTNTNIAANELLRIYRRRLSHTSSLAFNLSSPDLKMEQCQGCS